MNKVCAAAAIFKIGSLMIGCLTIGTTAARASAAERVAVLPISGVNMHPGYLEAAGDILKSHLLETGRYDVVLVQGPPGTQETGKDAAVAAARQAGANLAAVVHITRLAGIARIRFTVYRADTGAALHVDSIAIAGGPDDLDPALKRLAVGLATGRPASQTGDIDSVTQKEADPLLKQTATKSWGVRIGAIYPLNRPQGDAAAAPGLGFFWLYDMRVFMAEAWLDFAVSNRDKAGAFNIGIAGYYPFSKRNFTPYVGGGVAYSVVDFGGGGASGIRLHAAGGALVGRLWSVQLRGEVGYFLNTFSEAPGERFGPQGPEPVMGPRRFAHGPMLSVGIGF